MNYDFPNRAWIEQSHDTLRCFNCDRPLADVVPKASVYPPPSGAWRKRCPRCGLSVYYNLPSIKALDTHEA